MSKHTPGPWRFSGYCVYPPKPEGVQVDAICQMYRMHENKNGEANAHLIAAAPEMLEVLEKVHCDCSTMYPCDPSCFMPQVEKIIKKAKGEK